MELEGASVEMYYVQDTLTGKYLLHNLLLWTFLSRRRSTLDGIFELVCRLNNLCLFPLTLSILSAVPIMPRPYSAQLLLPLAYGTGRKLLSTQLNPIEV